MRINLLPPEIVERQRARRRTFAVAAAGVVALAVIGALFALQTLRLSDVEDQVEAQEATNVQLRTQIASLQDVQALEQDVATKRALLSTLLSDQVLWSGVLRDVSLVVPGETWLSGLNGQAGAAAAETEAPVTTVVPGAGLIGQISFSGFAFDHREVALWLSRLEDVRGFLNPWLANSAKTQIGTTEVVQFTSSVDLSEQALARARGEVP